VQITLIFPDFELGIQETEYSTFDDIEKQTPQIKEITQRKE
jgi:hypothetical protein